MTMPKPRLHRPRGRWLAIVALIAAAAVVVAIVVSNQKPANSGNTAGTTATGAATVQRRNLVATDTESGTLSYADSQTVYNRLSGTITWVPQVGHVVHAGQTLFAVDNKPVLLMNGSTPAYRDLTSTDISGPDVYELNKDLVDLGYDPDPIVVDDEWQSATTAGIDDMQYRHGETQTGKLTLGQVVFLPGPQMIQTVDTTVGSTAASYTPAAGPSQPLFVDYAQDSTTTGTDTATTGSTDTTDTTDTTGTSTGTTTTATGTTTTATGTTSTPATTTTTPKTSTTPAKSTTVSGGDNLSKRTLQALLRLIRQQQRELQAEQHANHSPSSPTNTTPANNSSDNKSNTGNTGNSGNTGNTGNTGNSGNTGNTGGGGGSAVAVLATSSTKLVVTVDLSASSQSEATIGEKVSVEMPNGGSVGGRITAVSPVAQSSSSDDSGGGDSGAGGDNGSGTGSSTVPVTIVLDKRAKGGGLDQASVSVNFVQSKARHVLSVPVTALLATSGSSFAVQEASRPHKLIPVQTGLFAAGYVAISGPGIHPGLQVTDSQG
jgi:Putative peptidoglycan binding domain